MAADNLLGRRGEAGGRAGEGGVVDIAPGLGALPRAWAAAARRVLAVEVDPALFAVLSEETAADLPNVRLLLADFLALDLEQVVPDWLGPGRCAVVANIPYSITSPVVVRLLEHRRLFDRIVLMVQ